MSRKPWLESFYFNSPCKFYIKDYTEMSHVAYKGKGDFRARP